ncbi:MAG: ROK family transcriptional regulator [Firmicutes bacterium]|nr:ROK family transcriptional regulator [Bacillota bacterium]
MLQGVNLSLVKAHNEAVVINLIRRRAPISRYELAELSGLTPPTISVIVNRLVLEGILVESGSAPSRGGSLGGRRRRYLALLPDSRLAIGILVNRTGCVGAVVNIAGSVQTIVNQPFGTYLAELSAQQLIAGLDRMLRGLLEHTSHVKPHVMGIGLGVPTWYPPDIDWQMVVNYLGQYGLSLSFANNAVSAALGEWWYGVGEVALPALYVFFGGGIGGCLITRGGPVAMPEFRPVELGHLGIASGGPPCYCGGQGCLENFIGHADEHHGVTKQHNTMQYVGYALRSLCHLLNIQTVILGGPEVTIVGEDLDELNMQLSGLRRIDPIGLCFGRISPENLALGAAALVFQTNLTRHLDSAVPEYH